MISVKGRERAMVGAFGLRTDFGTDFGTDTVCESTSAFGSLVGDVPANATMATASAAPATPHQIH
jgi:hypothetical protein